jgi:hypothetical protein
MVLSVAWNGKNVEERKVYPARLLIKVSIALMGRSVPG